MRVLGVIAIMLVGCGEPPLVMKPLPPLAPPMVPARELVLNQVLIVPGEHLIWEVQARGFTIGRAELSVGDHEITSRFRTSALISAVSPVEHDLTTVFADAIPQQMTERIEADGKVRQFVTHLAGSTTNSFHTALNIIRTWARTDAPPGFIAVAFADKMYRLDLFQPIAQGASLRVDGKIVGPDADPPIAFSLWLDDMRRPVRIEIRNGDDRVTAELIAS